MSIFESTDVTPTILEAAESIADGWYSDRPIEWDDFLYRLELHGEVDLGTSMTSPAIKKIQRHIRAYRKL